ncbi:ANTAR domain-containing response regulator [Indioceanicola profundi]|uniref:ANTAR domain-containing response regulator n=1 Tax=Indioceanicola profundi TaxID=2220096 RepID=UPI000E6AA6AD|nr:ANTAR domain-containing protein [Indioceanicola profundi]
MQNAGLSVAIVDENQMRAAILEEGLVSAGISQVTLISDTTNLLRQLVDLAPDVVIIDLENPSRDVLEQMFQVSRVVARPVAMFVDRSDSSMIQAAVDAGVSAYVVDGLRKERIKPIVDMAISRFNAFSRLQDELEKARNELAERKVIERAKGILMKTRKMSEEEAYAALRRLAMSDNRRIIDIAQSVVTAAKLLG